MELKHLLAITATCIGISGHGIAQAAHVSATVNTATYLSYFSGNGVTPKAFTGGAQNSALSTSNCPGEGIDGIGCSGLYFAAYDTTNPDPGYMYAPDKHSSVILNLREVVTIDDTYKIEVTDIDGISLPGKLGAVSISNDNSNFTFVGNIFGTEDGTVSLAGLGISTFQYIKIQQLDNPTGCSGNKTACGMLSLDSVLVNHSSVVPVPAAVWLFGSGLLGLVGVARKHRS